jgi:hypothetical protein
VSARYTTDIKCDGPACWVWLTGVTAHEPDVEAARAKAARSGWVHRDGLDLCRRCKEEADDE